MPTPRTLSRRAAVVVAALPLSLAGAGTASADHPAPDCPASASTTLVDLPNLRVRHHVASPTESRVCFDATGTSGILVVHTSSSTQPPVTVARADGDCAPALVSEAGVSVAVRTGPPALCVGVDGKTTTVTVEASGAGTSVEYWRDGGLLDETVFCLPELVEYLRMPEVNYEEYAECAYHPHRVI